MCNEVIAHFPRICSNSIYRMSITIFTPTYNREDYLSNLYKSLCVQTDQDFEWLIIDDGSSDSTEQLVNSFISENKIRIRYYKVENGGKHRAINKGVKLCDTELFFIVDSDDYLTPDAIEIVKKRWNEVKNDKNFCGVTGLRKYPDGKIVDKLKDFEIIDSNEINIKEYIGGDKADILKTEILKEYPFPEFENERFISESIVWYRMAQKYKVRYFSTPIYISEYLPTGLTRNIRKIHRLSPKGSMLLYKERIQYERKLHLKIKGAINYWRSTINFKGDRPESLKLEGIWNLFYIFGFIFHIYDLFKERKS